jgi:hypothetical protein
VLLYQSQQRYFKLYGDKPQLTFPCVFEVRIKLEPAQAFGGCEGQMSFVVRPPDGIGPPAIYYNANTGRVYCVPKVPMPRLDVEIRSADPDAGRIELKGNELRWVGNIDSLDSAQMTIISLTNVIPALLNLYFADPPFVTNTRGKIGSTAFNWELVESHAELPVADAETLEKHFAETVRAAPKFNGTDNRRLITGLRYYYTAKRLLVSGNSQWEFMAEHVLNLCKSLEVLFVRKRANPTTETDTGDTSRNHIREGLRSYGFLDHEIEREFVPLLILRGHFDVAHAKMALMNAEQLKILYRYLYDRGSHFRKLFDRIIEKLDLGTSFLPDDGNLTPDKPEQRAFDRLVESMAASETVARLPQ